MSSIGVSSMSGVSTIPDPPVKSAVKGRPPGPKKDSCSNVFIVFCICSKDGFIFTSVSLSIILFSSSAVGVWFNSFLKVI